MSRKKKLRKPKFAIHLAPRATRPIAYMRKRKTTYLGTPLVTEVTRRVRRSEPLLATNKAATQTRRGLLPENILKKYTAFQTVQRVSACENKHDRTRRAYFAFKGTGRKNRANIRHQDRFTVKC